MLKIYKKDNKIVIEIPFYEDRFNPYMGDEPVGQMPSITGVIEGNELSFCWNIDREYKGKDDDISSPFFIYEGDKESFVKLCEELGVEIFEYPICSMCKKTIFGTYTINEIGDVCFECSEK